MPSPEVPGADGNTAGLIAPSSPIGGSGWGVERPDPYTEVWVARPVYIARSRRTSDVMACNMKPRNRTAVRAALVKPRVKLSRRLGKRRTEARNGKWEVNLENGNTK